MPLSNNTVRRRIDEMSENTEIQLVEKLKLRKCSIQTDESTVSDSEASLLAYARYIDKDKFAEKMLFCELLETTTSATDIGEESKFKFFLNEGKTPDS